MSSTAQTKELLLSSSPSLLKEYDSLVRSSTITEEQFWSTRKDQLNNFEALLQQEKPKTLCRVDSMRKKFILTPDVMKSLFSQYPFLKKAFYDLVPSMYDNKSFWKTYLQSHYFNPSLPSENILNSYYIQEEEKPPSTPPPALSAHKKNIAISLENLNDNSFSDYLIKENNSNYLIRKLNFNSSREISFVEDASIDDAVSARSSTLAESNNYNAPNVLNNPIMKSLSIEDGEEEGESKEYIFNRNTDFYSKNRMAVDSEKLELQLLLNSPFLGDRPKFPNVSGVGTGTACVSLELLKLYYQSEVRDQEFICKLRQTLQENLPENPSHFLFYSIRKVLKEI